MAALEIARSRVRRLTRPGLLAYGPAALGRVVVGRVALRWMAAALAVAWPLLLAPASFALAAGDGATLTLSGGHVTVVPSAGLGLARTPEELTPGDRPTACREGFDVCLYLRPSAYAGTNLRSAGMAITRRDDLTSVTSCLLAQPTGWTGLQPAVNLPLGVADAQTQQGPATSRFGDVGEGAAGSYTTGQLLRLSAAGACWEFETSVWLSRFENYAPGAVKAFTDADLAHVEELFDSVLGSVAFDGHTIVWPDRGSGDLSDFVRVDVPDPATSPLRVTGEARGVWFFEATFPIELLGPDGVAIASGRATATGDWMTTGFVPFEAEIPYEIEAPVVATLVLRRDNPSGLPQNDAAAAYPVTLR